MLPPVILCIDDRPELLRLRKTTLEQRGYTVETAVDVTTAISVLANRPISAVLVDYKREGVDAQAAAYQIKQRYPSLPIVLLSAYSEMPESLLWLVDEYLMKSEPLEHLAEDIGKVISAREFKPRFPGLPRHLAPTG